MAVARGTVHHRWGRTFRLYVEATQSFILMPLEEHYSEALKGRRWGFEYGGRLMGVSFGIPSLQYREPPTTGNILQLIGHQVGFQAAFMPRAEHLLERRMEVHIKR